MGTYKIFEDPDVPRWKFWETRYTIELDGWPVTAAFTLSGAHKAIKEHRKKLAEREERLSRTPYWKKGDGPIYEEPS